MVKEKQMKETQSEKEEKKDRVRTPITTRGRSFEGFVVKKSPKRVVIDFERIVYIKKFERFYKKKTRIHARLPDTIPIALGDYVRVRECRPLSKMIHCIVTEKIRSADRESSKPMEESP